jgi:DNA-binding transcriptional MerR regulator
LDDTRDACLLTTGDVARRAGCSRESVLYAERVGRIPPATRTASGTRVYTAAQAAEAVEVLAKNRAAAS